MKALYFDGSVVTPVEAKVSKDGKTADLYIDDNLVVSSCPFNPENPGKCSYCKPLNEDKPAKSKKTKDAAPDGPQSGEANPEGDADSSQSEDQAPTS